MDGKKSILMWITLLISSSMLAMESSIKLPEYAVQFFHPGAYVTKDGICYIDAEDEDITLADYPLLKNGYEYLVREFAHKLSQGTHDELEQAIKNLNARITGSIASQYRTRPVNVCHVRGVDEQLKVLNAIRLYGTQQEQHNLESLLQKIDAHDNDFEMAMPYCNEQELDILRKIMFLAVLPDKIDPEMKQFVGQLRQKLHNDTNVFELAGYAHMRLVQIHPFNNANGRTARAVMNILLMLAGKHPLVFFSDKEYTAAVRQADKDSASFVQYLRDKEQQMHKLVEKNWQGTMCEYCRKEPATAKCSQCKVSYYCSSACQKNNWAQHKLTCKKQ